MRLTREMIQKWERNKIRAEERHRTELRKIVEKELRSRMKNGQMEFYIDKSLTIGDNDVEYVKECLRSWGFKASGGNAYCGPGIYVKVPSLEEFDGREE